ncbi:uncharacterized protein BKA55DRAFT_569292 [Fusarium redolens]|uniref:Uncharacterized protein n=1 Tax=Fusarium redolens TaxID=48865 RepID=A0A9P9GZN6_FUSRE|nr:uncharacterized protein BKA55DRAFT_569292 [Fusarium redolens]KAH7248493.1 hypothetical protein BKA55DRAFT_569292 [Fusarium redolens]
MASTWLDLSSLYGSTSKVALQFRSRVDGTLLTQEIQTPGTKARASHLPFNIMKARTNTRTRVRAKNIFAGDDPRGLAAPWCSHSLISAPYRQRLYL